MKYSPVVSFDLRCQSGIMVNKIFDVFPACKIA